MLVGFVAGARADRLAEMGESAAAEAALQQLQDMYANAVPTPRALFADAFMYDWLQVPHVRGGYSIPSPGARSDLVADRGSRAQLRTSQWSGRLVFCGEASAPYADVTVQAAVATGIRAAGQVRESLTGNLTE